MQTLIAFDIGHTGLRNRIEDACKDAGMTRIQWSLFQGEIDAARRRKLVAALEQRIADHTENESAELQKQALVVHLFALCAADFNTAIEFTRSGNKSATPVIPPAVVIL